MLDPACAADPSLPACADAIAAACLANPSLPICPASSEPEIDDFEKANQALATGAPADCLVVSECFRPTRWQSVPHSGAYDGALVRLPPCFRNP